MAETPHWVLVDKPAGFHTHAPEDPALRVAPRWNALGVLEKQLELRLYPVHRLDRATSGLLLFSKDRLLNGKLQEQFQSRTVGKQYFALVRGRFEGEALIDAALKTDSGGMQAAETSVRSCFSFMLPIPHPRGGSRDFTVVKADPLTGRFHQIRRHLAGLGVPLVGDSRHGDRKLNREFVAHTGCAGLFLRCMNLEFTCPASGERLGFTARWSRDWHKAFDFAGACALTASPSRERPLLS